jgi:hypothetical protein
VIRQAISCDICGTEKKQTNHWFVAQEHGGELRLSGWSSRNRSRAGSKHLCGQTCLHKLVDEFMARSLSTRTQPAATEPLEVEAHPGASDTSLTAAAAHVAAEPAPRMVVSAAPLLPRHSPVSVSAGPVAVPAQLHLEPAVATQIDEPPSYSRRAWRAEAWERERERELRSTERRPDIAARRHSNI